MFDTSHSRQTQPDQKQTIATQEPMKAKPSPQHSPDPTRLPLYTQMWNNQVPPGLHLSAPVQALQQEEPVQEHVKLLQRRANATGLPDTLKAGVENLSGLSMDDVRVHYDSSEPARLQALAYTQGVDIHMGPGQQQHLPHEAWHVVQQMQGRVKPILQAKGIAVNNDEGLENEADVMGARANHVSGGSLPGKEASGFDSLVETTNVNPFIKSILSKRDTISKPSTIVQKMEGIVPLLVLVFAEGYGHTFAEAQLAWSNSPTDILVRVVREIVYIEHTDHFRSAEEYDGYMGVLDEVSRNLSQLPVETHPQRNGAQTFVARLKFIIRRYSYHKPLGGIPQITRGRR
jgi:hypothetical protein